MFSGSEIKSVSAGEILDSRGNPTVEARVLLESGDVGIASVPSGASVGMHEAHELRDRDRRYGGRGVIKAVESVCGRISDSLVGVSALEQSRVDSIMIALDSTKNKSNLGANAILSVSLAVARAAAAYMKQPLYRYLGGALVSSLPFPMMNILNGGAHAGNNLDIQEFMIVPTGQASFCDSVRMCAEIYAKLKEKLHSAGLSTAVGDEGGFAPDLKDERAAIEFIIAAADSAGYRVGEEVSIALDVASSEWYSASAKNYMLPKAKITLSAEELCDKICELCRDYPIISIEDGMAEDDIRGWKMLTEKLGDKIYLVGDDLFVTNRERLDMGIEQRIANSILIKPNQIGTVSEVYETVELAKSKGYKTIMSHRSADTADTFIADLAVALGCDMIKSGAPCRSERVEKYNRLMYIENELFSPGIKG